MEYLKSLNEAQRAAVEATDGPVMIIAGAGSGKTRVLTYRIAHIINQGVDSFRILALTFTNKASLEMRDRIGKIVGPEAKNLWMGTFHSVFARILRKEAEKMGYPKNFSIYDTEDSKNVLKAISKEMGLNDDLYKVNILYNRISSAKNLLISPEAYQNLPQLTGADAESGRPLLGEVYRAYASRCFRAGAMDFDDLLFKTWQFFERYPEELAIYQQKFSHILVDEYQDTNLAQYKIVQMLAQKHKNLCVVGDDNQSIYAFRGASIENILGFEKDYPNLRTYKLEQNYRSTQNIVNAASSVIIHNTKQLKKNIFSTNDQGEKIRLVRAVSESDEAKIVASTIFEEKMRNQRNNSHFAILYRTNSQSRAFEESLRRMNIPYRIYGGRSFYQRKEIKDLLAYLKLVINQNDQEAFKRVINYPMRGIGKTSIDKLIVLADQHGKSLFEISELVSATNFGAGFNKILEFNTLIRSFQALEKQKDAYELAAYIAKQTGIQADLYNDKSVEGHSRFQNLEELLNGIKSYVDDETNEEKSLGAFLQNIALLTGMEEEDDGDADKLTLMTIHASKGLEYPVVFIVGVEENLFPSYMSINSREDLEEERRLFYVAMTRAEKKLVLTHATSRFKFGSITNNEPSRFLKEIDPAYLKLDVPISASSSSSPTSLNKWGSTTNTKSQNSNLSSQNQSSPSSMPTAPRPVVVAMPVRITPDENFVVSDTSNLQIGMKVEHMKFGVGKVTNMEGKDDIKATIIFEGLGEKQILLKFAKLMIHE